MDTAELKFSYGTVLFLSVQLCSLKAVPFLGVSVIIV